MTTSFLFLCSSSLHPHTQDTPQKPGPLTAVRTRRLSVLTHALKERAGDSGFIWDRRVFLFSLSLSKDFQSPLVLLRVIIMIMIIMIMIIIYLFCWVWLWGGGHALRLTRCDVLCPCFFFLFGPSHLAFFVRSINCFNCGICAWCSLGGFAC